MVIEILDFLSNPQVIFVEVLFIIGCMSAVKLMSDLRKDRAVCDNCLHLDVTDTRWVSTEDGEFCDTHCHDAYVRDFCNE